MLIQLYRHIQRNIKEDGLIVSSSRFLVSAMLKRVDFSRDLRILELGSGRGAITDQLIQRMSNGSSLDICEIKSEYNDSIHRLMASHPDKQVALYNSCVTQLLTRPGHYDVIISSLPLKNFEDAASANAFLYQILNAVQYGLREGGLYLQYQYFKSNQSDIEQVFGKSMDDVSFVPLNILPAFVYQMSKPAAMATPAVLDRAPLNESS